MRGRYRAIRDLLRRFLKCNGISWHNIKNFPRYTIWVMGMWWKHWRKSEPSAWKYLPRIWMLFPISVSCFVYDKRWDELGIGWKMSSYLWCVMPLDSMKKKPDQTIREMFAKLGEGA